MSQKPQDNLSSQEDITRMEDKIKEIANEIGVKERLQRDNIQRFIWESLIE